MARPRPARPPGRAPTRPNDRRDIGAQKRILAERFAGMGWEGRVALLGDAGYGATMGGMGAGVAIVGAYVLAGELALAGGDHRTAFAAYEIPDPGLRQGLPWMYRLLASRPLAAFFKRLTEQSATDIKLPEYPAG